MDVLPDLLTKGLHVVFCGTAAGNESARQRVYYAGQGNKFYSILNQIGLTDSLLSPNEYKKLLEFQLGLTDLVKKHSGNDDSLQHDMYDVSAFESKILKYQPKILCFNGKTAASAYLGFKTRLINYGIQPEKIGETLIYVAPSTSNSANGYWDPKIWVEIKDYL